MLCDMNKTAVKQTIARRGMAARTCKCFGRRFTRNMPVGNNKGVFSVRKVIMKLGKLSDMLVSVCK